MRFFAAVVSLMLAAPVAAQHPTNVDIEVESQGPMIVGGSSGTTLLDLRGEMYIPVSVAMNCKDKPAQEAMLFINFQPDEDGYGTASMKIIPAQGVEQTSCTTAAVNNLAQYTLRLQLAGGAMKVNVGGGPLAGMTLMIEAWDG